MTEKWKPKAGDDVVVKLYRTSLDYGYFLCNDRESSILLSALKPVPVAMTVAQAALIEGCIERRHTIRDGALLWSLADLVYAVLAERAPRVPPDPVEVAWRASNCVDIGEYDTAPDWFRDACKAYVAAGGGKS